MFQQFLTIATSVSSLLLLGEDTETPDIEEYENYTQELSQSQSIFYMDTAEEEPEEYTQIREETQRILEEREEKRALEESERLTEEKREEMLEEYEENFHVVEGNSSQAEFINEISRESVEIAYEHGIYPSVMIAQAGLESRWGNSSLAREYNNLMGTKGSWNGNSVTMRTREDTGDGSSVYINAGFSVYDSWSDSLERYGQLMSNGPGGNASFYAGVWRENTDSYRDATEWLQGRYATDTQYTAKLNQTIENFDLHLFDELTPISEDLELIEVQVEPENISLDAPENIYEVQEGDSLFSISLIHDVSIEELLEWNELQSPILHVNQWVTIEETDDLVDVTSLLNE